ncbi:MAG: alpha-glucuronidase, partial [Blautia sp.]|nr:alpha-glucuronidase [Blautia sp.]
AQEYTGQQIDVCYLVPLMKEVLDFDTCAADGKRLVKERISRGVLKDENAGIAAVANTGDDLNWTGSDLAGANLYGFGRLSFDMDASALDIAKEWAALTFGPDEEVVSTIVGILMDSRETYEKYTSPLGLGWMVTPGVHYGCSVDGYEYSRWGTYHRADHLGVGIDRSSRGTGFVLQYQGENVDLFDDIETCPMELLLFFHRAEYTHVLRNGKTLIQHIYDEHFEGYERVEEMIRSFKALKGSVEKEVYDRVMERFALQLENAREWRDQVNSFFYRLSMIPDEKGRPLY